LDNIFEIRKTDENYVLPVGIDFGLDAVVASANSNNNNNNANNTNGVVPAFRIG